METAEQLSEAYERCRLLQRRHDPTYYWATRRLPARVRPATHALYGYVRVADQLVDGPRRAREPSTRRAALDAWEAELDAPRHPIARALADAAGRHDLPLGELHAYMDAMRVDCAPVRMAGWDELDAYMDGSAGTVGRVMAVLLDVPPDARPAFGRLGQAFQLTNFLRDVREDAELGRVYVPLGPAGLADGPALQAAVAEGVERARARFAGCEDAVGAAPPAMRPGIRIACSVYARVLDQLEAVEYDVLRRRTSASPWRVAAATLGALVAPRRLSW